MKEIETDNNVVRKTPEEIKKGILCDGPCNECAYRINIMSYGGCSQAVVDDTIALIEQLERERDTAIEDIKVAATFLCQTCKKYHPAVIDGTKHFCDEIPADHFDDGAIACGMYEWRGVKE